MGEKFVKAVPKEEAIQHAPEMTPENEADIPQSGVFLTRNRPPEFINPFGGR